MGIFAKMNVSSLYSPGEGNGNLLQYSCLENPQEQRSLADYTVHGGLKKSDMTEHLGTACILGLSNCSWGKLIHMNFK